MKIELINSLSYTDFPGIQKQIARVKSGVSDELWIASQHEDAAYLLKNKLGIDLNQIKVFDMINQEYLAPIDEQKGLWWADVPLPNQAQLNITKQWDKLIISQGKVIGQMEWFPNSQRFVRSVTWYDFDGQIDYRDIYRRDGTLFATQYFSSGEVLEMNLFNSKHVLSNRFFYFNQKLNFVISDKLETFDGNDAYIKAFAEKYHQYEFIVAQLGRELSFAPQNSVLDMTAGIKDSDGHIFGNLLHVMKETQPKFKRILVDSELDRRLLQSEAENDINIQVVRREK